jgi:hypothetical protein
MTRRLESRRGTWIATVVGVALAGCGGDGGSGTDTGTTQDSGSTADVTVSPCGASGPFGMYTGVRGGQSGVMACGRTFTSFTGATLTITPGDAGSALLTVSGTGTVGDTTDCPAMIDGCNVTATACPTGGGSTISYTLMTYSHQLSGTVRPSIPGPGGGCLFTYSIEGTR